MPDFLIELIKWISHPDLVSLTTVAGLAVFLKLIAIPFIKWIAVKLKKDISGWKTIVTVYITSIVIAELSGLLSLGFKGEVALAMVVVGISAAAGAVGLQQTTKLATDPTKI